VSSARVGLSLGLALVGAGLISLAAGCRAPAPLEPGHSAALCCKAAADDEVSFIGCRQARVCRANESVWVRGPLACTDASDSCKEGLCCELVIDEAAKPEPDAQAHTESDVD